MSDAVLDELTSQEYQHGFVTDIESDVIPPGLSEEIVRPSPRRRASPSGCSSGG